MESDEQEEALRLLQIEGITARALSKRSRIDRKELGAQAISNYKHGHKRMTKRMANRIINTYWKLADELTPRVKRVNNENGD
jgi:hydrogenase maturation factor HypE